jgi:rhodanese-related sulfurtransferase
MLMPFPKKMRLRRPHSRRPASSLSTLDARRAVGCRSSRGASTGRRLWTFLTALAVAAAYAGPGCSARKFSDRDLVLVDATEAMELVGTHKRLLGLAGDTTGAWVDPRHERAYREGHIPGAISLPFQRVTADQRLLRGYDVLVVYGDDYQDPIANGMSKRLMELGFKDVRTLRGGLRAWTDAGYELETVDE